MMYGQMTAGSWIYIGSQGIVQGTYETFAEAGRQHYGGELAGKWILTAGLGGMGGAQPLAATMAGASMLADRMPAEPHRHAPRARAISTGRRAISTTRSRSFATRARAGSRCPSGSLGNAAEILPELVRRGVRPDMVTDQTSAHDLVYGYLPAGWTRRALARGAEPIRRSTRRSSPRRSSRSSRTSRRCSRSSGMGVPTFDYGNNIRQVALDEGVRGRVRISRLRAGVHPAAVLRRQGAVPLGRAVRRSGGHLQDRPQGDGALPDDAHLHRWLDMARERIAFQGLPARICWLGLGERHLAGLAFNEMVKTGELKAPIVIGRDHLDTGSRRESQPRDRSDGRRLATRCPTGRCSTLLLNTAGGATWVSFHHGGGVGMGYSQHAGVVIVCDGTDAAAKRIARVLWNDPATGVMRHADAGYAKAIEVAKAKGLKLPMLPR